MTCAVVPRMVSPAQMTCGRRMSQQRTHLWHHCGDAAGNSRVAVGPVLTSRMSCHGGDQVVVEREGDSCGATRSLYITSLIRIGTANKTEQPCVRTGRFDVVLCTFRMHLLGISYPSPLLQIALRCAGSLLGSAIPAAHSLTPTRAPRANIRSVRGIARRAWHRYYARRCWSR